MSKKYFCVSDVHGFYSQMISALNMAGYSKDNENHVLIVNGDIFDRGSECVKIYEFLKSIPKSRKILIKGNHEQLVTDVVLKDFPDSGDFHNGTVSTIFQFADEPESVLREFLYHNLLTLIDKRVKDYWKSMTKRPAVKEMIEWLESDEWIDYFELDNFIFTHSFIPLRRINGTSIYGNFNYNDYLKYNKNWRTDSTEYELNDAKWGCPWRQYQAGLFKKEEQNNKTLVCGHWHTSDFHKHLGKDINSNRHDIYFSKGIIALDGGVRVLNNEYIYDCNVLVIDNNECYDKLGNKLSAR